MTKTDPTGVQGGHKKTIEKCGWPKNYRNCGQSVQNGCGDEETNHVNQDIIHWSQEIWQKNAYKLAKK